MVIKDEIPVGRFDAMGSCRPDDLLGMASMAEGAFMWRMAWLSYPTAS